MISDPEMLEAMRDAHLVIVDMENGFIVLVDDFEARLLSRTCFDLAVDGHIALCYHELATSVGKRIPLPVQKGQEGAIPKFRVEIDCGPSHAIRLVPIETTDDASSDSESGSTDSAVSVSTLAGVTLQTGRGYLFDTKQFSHTQTMTAFVPQPKFDDKSGFLQQGDTANLFPLKIRTSRPAWALDQNTMLVGPKAIHLREYHIFSGKIKYGIENEAFWRQVSQRWFLLFLSQPLDHSERCNEWKSYGWDPNCDPFKLTETVLGVSREDRPLGLRLLFNRVFNSESESTSQLDQISQDLPLKDVIEYCQLARDCVSGCMFDALGLLRRKLTNTRQIIESILRIEQESSQEVSKWFDIFASFLSVPLDIQSLQQQISHLQSSNLPIFNRIIIAVKNAMKGGAKLKDDGPIAFNDILSHYSDERTEVSKLAMRGIFDRMQSRYADVKILVMGRTLSTNAQLLRSTWKYYENFVQFIESPSKSETTEMDPNLDFGTRLTPNAVQSLIRYFSTGDPDITSYVDAVSILEMAEELLLCDSNGIPLPGHESLFNQLIFTTQTARLSENDSFTGLALSYAIQNTKLQVKCESRIRSYFEELSSSWEANWFSQSFPAEYSALAWSTVVPNASK